MAKRPDYSRLTDREIWNFVSNAQLALVEKLDDKVLPAIHYYKTELNKTFIPTENSFTPIELAAVLVSVAWDILNNYGGLSGKKISRAR